MDELRCVECFASLISYLIKNYYDLEHFNVVRKFGFYFSDS